MGFLNTLDTAIVALLGYAMVFVGLIALMVVVMIIGKIFTSINEKAAKKAEALAKAQASPNYASGQVKMQQNSAKAAAKSVKRKAARDVAKPGYQRALAKFQGYSPEKLQGIVSSSKSSPVEKLVAGDLLAALK